MALAIAFTAAQLDILRTTAAPLTPPQRRRYLERLGESLRGRSSIGDGELSRLAHAVAHEVAEPQRRPARGESADIRGFGVTP